MNYSTTYYMLLSKFNLFLLAYRLLNTDKTQDMAQGLFSYAHLMKVVVVLIL